MEKISNVQTKNNSDLTKQFEEVSLNDIAEVLSLTIKDDDSNKKIVFLCMLSAYTDKSQINVSLNAPSSTGKTYLATQIAKLFPDEDKIERSGASPTSFFYGEGVQDKVRKAKIVSLRRKILIFYEQPNPALQERLRALLSHDSREVTHSLVNRNKGRNQTDTIIIEGFAATVFCSAGLRLDEQEATRAILLSPEATHAKLKQAVHLQARRGANEAEFADWLAAQPKRNKLMERIVAIREEKVGDIIIPDPAMVEKRFMEYLPSLQPRHSRDIDHLMQLIKAITLLNVWYRRAADGTIIATESDVDQGFELWSEFFDSQNMNLPPAVLSIYKKYIVPAYMEKITAADENLADAMRIGEVGLTRLELNTYYMNQEGSAINDEQLRKQVLPQLEAAGLIVQEKPDGDDKRSKHIFPKWLSDENKNYIGNGGVESIELSNEILELFFGNGSKADNSDNSK